MAFVDAVGCLETSNIANNTDPYSLLGTPDGSWETLLSRVGSGNTMLYLATDGVDREIGIGTVTSGQLSRDRILQSTNADAPVDWDGDNLIYVSGTIYPNENITPIGRKREALGSQAANVNWNAQNGVFGFTVTLTGNANINAPSNLPSLSAGEWVPLQIEITQDATGNRVPVPNAIFVNFPTLSTAANTIDHIRAFWNGTSIVCESLTAE